jgi:hypothetical protein
MSDTHVFVYFWVGLCIAIGIFANRYGRSGFGWFVISMLVSPLLGFVFVLALGRRSRTAS